MVIALVNNIELGIKTNSFSLSSVVYRKLIFMTFPLLIKEEVTGTCMYCPILNG
jgi:hypothetical protein